MVTFKNEINVIKTFNMGLLLTMLAIFILGFLTLYSAQQGPGLHSLYKQQLLWFSLGIFLGISVLFVDSQILEKMSYPIYGICLISLVAVLFIGEVGGGAQRWLKLGPLRAQPSEFAKIAIVFALAKYFSEDKVPPPYTLKRLVLPGLLIAPLFVLILLQPDLGTAGVLLLVAGSMVYFLKIHWKSILIVAVIGLITVPIAYKFVLKPYQRDRVKIFLNPGADAKGSGYNALQCKIAVGSGEIFGKGYLKGTQSQLNFIPEMQTDFIFSVFSEERGFVGGLILSLLYMMYCFFALRTVGRARDKFEMLLAFGLVSIVFWHVFINMGMVIGLLPIVGVGLPFFSYGGSMLVVFMLATALILNLSRKRYIF